MSLQEKAAEQSWQCEFYGDAAGNLWNHIVRHYGPHSLSSVSSIYANYASIVQSSGMGKSRTVDELAKTHFLIPINLRPPESIGFPAADEDMRDFLTAPPYRMETQNSTVKAFFARICAFLKALMFIAARRIEELDGHFDDYTDEGIAAAFRGLMCNGQTMSSHNEYRNTFYREVIDEATKILKGGDDMNNKFITTKSPGHSRHVKEFGPSVACGRLLHALDRSRSSGKQKEKPAAVGGSGTGFLSLAPKTAGESDPMRKRRAKIVDQKQTPRIVLAFDEA
ncbi:uncharacterized protein LAESUDRAFT_328454 [Laetiporus sulphureus 93-53]|uniref:Uncharacterized protein n=1 Tax=Laetiporus sulphureus 93-53 TaxID=1314785 RepID=A0A165CWT6_9APHY|nr:uncharacterized protein LAESUDRAFT_328454 [Laetiporus sulphureus 93-53]KZT03613.1 hypothetical protein LAESUDRAFT_328454 [Laetiporus sulphureus 93-53]